MAIDPKELRIGSHIDVNGVRARVTKIDEPKSNEIPPYVILCFTAVIDGELREAGGFPHDDKINPIPITPELLKEIGLPILREKQNEWATFDNNIVHIEIWNKVCVAEVRIGDRFIQFEPKYLHELENFVYLTTKQELIND